MDILPVSALCLEPEEAFEQLKLASSLSPSFGGSKL